MMASGPVVHLCRVHRSGGYVRSGHLAAPERRASSPLRVCVRIQRAKRVLPDIRFAKILRLQFLQNRDRLYSAQFRSLPVDSIGSTRHIH